MSDLPTQPYSQEGYDLMGAAFEVHKQMGGGLSEEIYQESLEIELGLRDIAFKTKPELEVSYKGKQLKKCYIPDLMISEGMIAELKAVSALLSEHEAQLLNYMRISKKRIGYLINFGPISKLEWKRFIL